MIYALIYFQYSSEPKCAKWQLVQSMPPCVETFNAPSPAARYKIVQDSTNHLVPLQLASLLVYIGVHVAAVLARAI